MIFKNLEVPLSIITLHKLPIMMSQDPAEESGYILWSFDANAESVWNLSEILKSSYKALWIIKNESYLDVWNNTFVLPDSNIFVLHRSIDDGVFFNESYKVKPTSPMLFKPWGIWSLEAGIFELNVHKWDRRSNLSGLHIRTGALNNTPFSIIEQWDDNPSITGYYGEIWKALQQVLNFDYSITLSVDGKWGSIDESGNWDGLVGMAVRDEIDIACSDLALSTQRGEALDFTQPILKEQ